MNEIKDISSKVLELLNNDFNNPPGYARSRQEDKIKLAQSRELLKVASMLNAMYEVVEMRDLYPNYTRIETLSSVNAYQHSANYNLELKYTK